MNALKVRLLLIEDDPGDARLVRVALDHTRFGPFEMEWVNSFTAGVERLARGGIDLVLTDLSLPDSHGMETVDRLLATPPRIPILVLSGLSDESAAAEAIPDGAQDYLPKSQLRDNILPRTIRNTVSRRAVEEDLYRERERAQVTLNSIGDAVLCTDKDAKITYLNGVAEKMTGWPSKEAVGRAIEEVFQIIDSCFDFNPALATLHPGTPLRGWGIIFSAPFSSVSRVAAPING